MAISKIKVGDRFGHLTVIEQLPSGPDGRARLKVECDCGTVREVSATDLRSGGQCPCRVWYLLKSEKEEFAALDHREEAAKAILNNPEATSNSLENAQRAIRRTIPTERAKIQERIDARQKQKLEERITKLNAIELAKVTKMFPDANPAGEQRDDLLLKLQQHYGSLTGIAQQSSGQYLYNFIHKLKQGIKAQAEAIQNEEQSAQERQNELNEAACDKATAQIITRIQEALKSPLSSEIRARLQDTCKDNTAKSRALAKTDTSLRSDGAETSAVAQALADVFSMFAKRLNYFGYEVYDPTSMLSLKQLENLGEKIGGQPEGQPYFPAFSCSTENWIWRTQEEQSLLRHATVKYLRAAQLTKFIDTLPKAPEPIEYPKNPRSLSYLNDFEDQKIQVQTYREQQEMRRRAEIEKLHVQSSSKDWAKIQKKYRDALKPVDVEPTVTVYLVPVSTLEHPNMAPEWYFGHGEKVQQGVHVLFDGKYWHMPPDPAGTSWSSRGRTECVQDDYGNWIRRSVDETEYQQNLAGEWVPAKKSQTRWDKPIRIVFEKADRQPAGKDHCFYGHWFSKAEVDAYYGNGSTQPPLLLEPLQKTVADFVAEPIESRHPDSAWGRYERSQKSPIN